MNCRHCSTPLEHVFLDLGFAPPSNAYLSAADLQAPEQYFPLKLFVCGQCWLVQTEDYSRSDELFTKDYAYFSSVSTTWLAHARSYVDMITARLGLGANSFVIEVASNDGYLLKNFVASGVPCLGVEPTDSTAAVAEAAGIPVAREFFGQDFAGKLVKSGRQADLIIGNNVYAHVPDINDFTAGMKTALKPGGTITLEFPHLMSLMRLNQFDTVYHEHYSYLSLQSVKAIFARAGLRVCDVEQITTHGGSLRVYGCHADDARVDGAAVARILAEEIASGLQDLATYQRFQREADKVKNKLLAFLVDANLAGKTMAAYGAAAKGNTLMNYAGVKPDLVSFVCDAAASKQGKFMPGSHIPILAPKELRERRPDYVLILPWNIADEVVKANEFVREWGGKFVVAVPALRIF
jgi:SAM-dependent methyltransferase